MLHILHIYIYICVWDAAVPGVTSFIVKYLLCTRDWPRHQGQAPATWNFFDSPIYAIISHFLAFWHAVPSMGILFPSPPDPLLGWFLLLLWVCDQTVPSVEIHPPTSRIGLPAPWDPMVPLTSLVAIFLSTLQWNVWLPCLYPSQETSRGGWGSLMCSLLYFHSAWQPYSRYMAIDWLA